MSLLPESFELQVATPNRLVLAEEQVHELQAPGKDGYLGILPGHAPLLGELGRGILSYRRGSAVFFMVVFGGFLEVLGNRVIVLADSGERAEEVDLERARAARGRAEERLKKADPDVDVVRAQAALTRALTRLDVAERAGARAPGRLPEETERTM